SRIPRISRGFCVSGPSNHVRICPRSVVNGCKNPALSPGPPAAGATSWSPLAAHSSPRPSLPRGGNRDLVNVGAQGVGQLPLEAGEEAQAGQLLHLAGRGAVPGPIRTHALVVGHDDGDDPGVPPRQGALAGQDHGHLPQLAGDRHLQPGPPHPLPPPLPPPPPPPPRPAPP